MTALRLATRDYLELRNGLGRELVDAARLLPCFVTYLSPASGVQWHAIGLLTEPDAAAGSVDVCNLQRSQFAVGCAVE
jgi:hypothetical protein